MLTRKSRSKKISRKVPPPGTWKLQDAKAHFSEVVRRARTAGPQRVTLHGKDAVVIIAADDYQSKERSDALRTGAELIDAMQQARKLGLKLKPLRFYPPIRPAAVFADDER